MRMILLVRHCDCDDDMIVIVIVMMWQQKQCSINLVGARCGKANALIVQWRWYNGKACSDSTMVIVRLVAIVTRYNALMVKW